MESNRSQGTAERDSMFAAYASRARACRSCLDAAARGSYKLWSGVMGVSPKMSILFVGVLITNALPFGAYIRATDFWKLPYGLLGMIRGAGVRACVTPWSRVPLVIFSCSSSSPWVDFFPEDPQGRKEGRDSDAALQ